MNSQPDSDHDADFDRYQRELALVDEIVSLKAALGQEASRNSPARQTVERLEKENRELRGSTTWRVGRIIMGPGYLLKRVAGRARRP